MIHLYMFWKLPAAWFMGVRLQKCDGARAEVRLRYSWFSQNPFKSIYFAAQCAAGEFSTGILVLEALKGQPPVSMLVTHIEAEFYKKASQTLIFTCEEGAEIKAAVQQTLSTGEPVTLRMTSTGRLPDGAEATKVWVTWSLKAKSKVIG